MILSVLYVFLISEQIACWHRGLLAHPGLSLDVVQTRPGCADCAGTGLAWTSCFTCFLVHVNGHTILMNGISLTLMVNHNHSIKFLTTSQLFLNSQFT